MVLNETLIENFAKEIEEGLPFKYTCDLLEISQGVASAWMKQGESDKQANVESLERKFFISIKRAYAKFLKESKKKMDAKEKGWQGIAWWLERTNRDFILTNDAGDVVEPVIVKPTMPKNKK